MRMPPRLTSRLSLGWCAVLAAVAFRLYTVAVALSQHDAVTQLHQRNDATSVFGWWDGQWYLRIARQGYDPHFLQHSKLGLQSSLAFPPALATLMAGTHRVFGLDLTVAGLLWGFVALLLACVGLARLVALDHGRRVAQLTLLAMLVWPPAMFLGMLYQDVITVAGVVWAFLLVRQHRPTLAGVALSIAVLSKLVVIVALLALVIEHLTVTQSGWRRPPRSLVGLVALPALTIAGWFGYGWHRYGRATATLDTEKAWGHHLSTPWDSVAASMRFLHAQSTLGYQIALGLDFVAVGLTLVALIWLLRARMRRAYVVYTATMLVALTTNGRLTSADRYLLMVFPVFLAAALAMDKLLRRHAAALAGGAAAAAAGIAGQVWLTLRFARYYWAG